MIGVILGLIKQGMDFFIKTKTIEQEVKVTKEDGQIELNKHEIDKTGFHWRNALGFVLTAVIAYNWIIVPIMDYFGVVLIQVPLGQLFQILLIMVGGS
ncbi:hypothetical protein CI789_11945 [Erwinia persicina]|uniref:hypothetical protein n=1 Tax=Erwinia persicina TaxID=55211 RepID=UPI000E493B95|nr:hypothetical protein [Erwinia persicina]AXU95884.1 hypothetical protein CI789_11945 [Erwinia persicina]